MPNARATSPDGYSECGYVQIKSTSSIYFKTLNYRTLIAVASILVLILCTHPPNKNILRTFKAETLKIIKSIQI